METCALFNCYSDIFSHLHEFSIEFNCLLYNHIQKVPFQSDQMCTYLAKTFLLVKTKAKIQNWYTFGKKLSISIWPKYLDSNWQQTWYVHLCQNHRRDSIQKREAKNNHDNVTWSSILLTLEEQKATERKDVFLVIK